MSTTLSTCVDNTDPAPGGARFTTDTTLMPANLALDQAQSISEIAGEPARIIHNNTVERARRGKARYQQPFLIPADLRSNL